MKRALRPAKRMLGNNFCKRGAPPCTSQFLFSQTACWKLHTPFSSNYKGQANCSLSFARFLSSRSKHSPADIRSPIPDMDIPVVSFAELIFNRCEEFKDKIAVSDLQTGRMYTFRDLKTFAIRVASGLHRQGYRKGDVIVPFTINLPEFSILFLAAACLGVIVSPVSPAYKAAELSHILTNNRAKAIFTLPQLIPVVKDVIEDPEFSNSVKAIYTFERSEQGFCFFNDLMEDDGKEFPENVDIDPLKDIVALPYSSGTTGLPKGVMLSHYNLVANIKQVRALLKVCPHDKELGLLPFFHIYGLLPVLFSSIYEGTHLVTVPHFEPELFLRTMQEEKISILHAVPPIVLFLAKHPLVANFNLSAIKYIVCGAAPLDVPLTKECQDRLGAPIYQGYGLTDTSPVVNVDWIPGHPGTIGYLVPNTQAKLVNPETGAPVELGEMGEYCIKGPQTMLGYYNNQQATDQMIDPSGWLHTGDLGFMRDDGFVEIVDRLKELIKYKGYQVPPSELESLLLTHPAVQDVGVIGIPHEGDGELPRAYVVVKPNMVISQQDLCDFVEKLVNPHKRLRGGVVFVDEIPKTPSGKILRRVLKAKALQSC